jgi:hypothetical protein
MPHISGMITTIFHTAAISRHDLCRQLLLSYGMLCGVSVNV